MTHATATGTCPHGHPWTPENTYVRPNGTRNCRTCNRAAAHAWKEANREANRARDRAHARSARDECPECGALKEPESLKCMGCIRDASAKRRALVERLWAEGKTMREINRELGIAEDSVYVVAMRARGWYLPHRRADFLPSDPSCKTPGNQIDPGAGTNRPGSGNQERGS